MHKWVYDNAECLKNELQSTGFDNLDCEKLEKAYYISKILKNLVEVDQGYHVVDAMEKSEKNEEIMEKLGKYTDYPSKNRYYDDVRYRAMPYDDMSGEPPYKHSMDDRELSRDMDRMSDRRMYTPDEDMHSGNAWKYRKKYMETKEKHKSNSADDKQPRMTDLEKYLKSDMSEWIDLYVDAFPEEKTLMKNIMSQTMSKM